MTKWRVTFEGGKPGKEDDTIIELFPVDEVIPKDQQFTLTKSYLQSLAKLMAEQDHYITFPNIKTIISPTGEDLSNREIITIQGQYKTEEGENYLSVLLGLQQTGDWKILGLGPPSVEYTKKDVKYLQYFLSSVTSEPSKWSNVMVIGPLAKTTYYV